MGEDGEWDSLPWQNHEPSPTEVTEKTTATELQTRPTIGKLEYEFVCDKSS